MSNLKSIDISLKKIKAVSIITTNNSRSNQQDLNLGNKPNKNKKV